MKTAFSKSRIYNQPFSRKHFGRRLNEQRAWALVTQLPEHDMRLFLPGSCVTMDEIALAATADIGVRLKSVAIDDEWLSSNSIDPESLFADVGIMARYEGTDKNIEVLAGLVDDCLYECVDFIDYYFMQSFDNGGTFEILEIAGSTIE